MASKKSVNSGVKEAKETREVRPYNEHKEHKTRKPLSPAQKGSSIVFGIVRLLLTVWALWDINHRPNDQINGKKRSWVMASFIPLFGPASYFVFGRKGQTAHLAA